MDDQKSLEYILEKKKNSDSIINILYEYIVHRYIFVNLNNV